MSEPLNPNRVGGVRGPNGTTLEDISGLLTIISNQLIAANNRLAAIEASSASTLSNIVTLLARVTVLTGATASPPAFGSLPAYLISVIGPRAIWDNLGFDPGYNMASLLNQMDGTLADLRLLSEGLDPVFKGSGWEHTPRLTVERLLRIADALKQQGELPEDSSIFRLLASIDTNVAAIEDCACDDDVTPPPDFPPPVAACLGQAAAYELCTLEFAVSINSSPPVDVWNVVWPSISAGRSDVGIRSTTYPSSIPPNQTSHQLSYIGPTVEVGDGFEGCLAWNFEGDTNFITINSANHVNTAPYVSTSPLPPSLSNRASIAFSIPDPTTGSSFRGLAACVTVASGSVPQGKVYVQVVPLQPAS